MHVFGESCKFETVLTLKVEKTEKGTNQSIHENLDTYVAPVPYNNLTKRTKIQWILPLTRKIVIA